MEPVFNLQSIKAIIGLGNPGQKYYRNRHNIGFRVVDAFAEHYNGSWHTVNDMEVATVRVDDHTSLKLRMAGSEIHVIKPLTFMNNSGRVLSWLTKKGVKPDQILVVHDELEKEFGKLVLKFGGSHKGHNGLKSIISIIGADFWRFKFGIGRPESREDVPNYVLENFPPAEEQRVAVMIDAALELITNHVS